MIPCVQNPSLPPILEWPEKWQPKSIIKKDRQNRSLQLEALASLEYHRPLLASSVAGGTLATPSLVSTLHMPSQPGVSTDTSSIFSSTGQISGPSTALGMASRGTPVRNHRHDDGYDDYILMFNRSTGSQRVLYLMVDPNRRGRILPKVNYVTFNKVNNLVSYRVTEHNNFLYILGGRNLESGNCVPFCYRYNPKNNQWMRIANMIHARCRFTASSFAGCIYVVGGQNKTGRITNAVECYDPVMDSWTEVKPLPQPRADHAACVAEGRLFISGGIGDTKKSAGRNVFWQYNPRTDFWSQSFQKSTLPQGRERHNMVEHKGKIYVLGGLTWSKQDGKLVQKENDRVSSFECNKGNIDSRITGLWDETGSCTSRPRCMAGAVVLGHNIFMIGGYNYTEKKIENTVEYYNTRKKKWYDLFPLGKELNFHSVDVVIIRVPQSNRWYSHLTPAIQGNWTLW